MKAFLLAAGCGRRLRPLTDAVPKCLLPIAGRPLLFHWFRLLADAGVGEVLVNTHHLAALVEAAVAGWHGPLRVRLVNEPQLLGSGGTLAANREFVDRERDFFVIYADNLTSAPLRPLLAAHREGGSVLTTYVYETSTPSQKGICEIEAGTGRIVGFEEKPLHPRSRMANAGIAVAAPGIFDVLPASRPLNLARHVMPALVGRMRAVLPEAPIRDIGTLPDFVAAQVEWCRAAGEAGRRPPDSQSRGRLW